MCQISVVVEREGQEEKIMDNVTRLDVVEDGVVLNTFFEDPQEVRNVTIQRIDFLGGTVFLAQSQVSAKEGK